MPKKAPQWKAAEIMPSIDNDTWVADESAGPTLVGRLFGEFLGTFLFMFVGLGITVFTLTLGGKYDGYLTAGLAWGIGLVALIAVVGPISGAHFNPAVTIGLWVAGRFPGRDVALYIVLQVAGAVGAGGLVYYFAGTFAGVGDDLAAGDVPSSSVMAYVSIGYGDHSEFGTPSPVHAALFPAILMEFLATAMLVAIVLGATSKRASKAQAPLAIGFGIAVLVMLAGPLTNAGLNPARDTATAVFAWVTNATTGATANWALSQLWVWWVVTIVAGAFVGLLYRGFGPIEDLTSDDANGAIGA
jgi:aquaporin Z